MAQLTEDYQYKISRASKALEIANHMAESADAYLNTFVISNHINEISLHTEGYAEPGYDADMIAVGNWNNVTKYNRKTRQIETISTLPSRLANIFEKLGIELEWSDQWSTCDGCCKLVRTCADSYCWKASYVIINDQILCSECIEEDLDEYLEFLEQNNELKIHTLDNINLKDFGYLEVNKFESGFHPGQTSDPKKIYKALSDIGCTKFVFCLDESSQFYSIFSVWLHEDE